MIASVIEHHIIVSTVSLMLLLMNLNNTALINPRCSLCSAGILSGVLFEEAFTAWDKDGDGRLTRFEFEEALGRQVSGVIRFLFFFSLWSCSVDWH